MVAAADSVSGEVVAAAAVSVLGEAIVPLSGVSGWVRVPDSEGTGWAWAADLREEK